VLLQENRSAGYRWRVSAEASPQLAFTGNAAVGAPAQALGAPRERAFSFEARIAGRARLEFAYGRSRDATAEPARTCVFTILVS
jgi:predicted secreted protein